MNMEISVNMANYGVLVSLDNEEYFHLLRIHLTEPLIDHTFDFRRK